MRVYKAGDGVYVGNGGEFLEIPGGNDTELFYAATGMTADQQRNVGDGFCVEISDDAWEDIKPLDPDLHGLNGV